jgi:hypothetical protein
VHFYDRLYCKLFLLCVIGREPVGDDDQGASLWEAPRKPLINDLDHTGDCIAAILGTKTNDNIN